VKLQRSSLHLVNLSAERMPRKFLQKFYSFCIKELKKKPHLRGSHLLKTSCSIVLVTPRRARELNFQFRKKTYTPDVLSFSFGDELGEVILCAPVVRLRAASLNWSFRDYLAYLSLHGLLHLLGYDHELNQREEKIMFALQESLWEQWEKLTRRERTPDVNRF
jgi:probable rRNA maturation factor